ncbi:hypothetical protein UA08_01928 [Talaromyces atroroseus]|uniref:DUF7704 domain-containing protein n=1 Tax=Talaromyces atroroseus TaxID=1441469 RepID=A0A1Q5QCB5_TALAT|nr:hypothetical protein UA08_01928 [Talaromyces atroroseus]OKL63560.1 hypothetical protein UA08_01928 [Talaromyces atroroseus]
MPTLYPTWPFILFAVVEPISMVAGTLAPIIDTNNFIAGQFSLAHPPALPHHPSVLALNYQLANIYGLVGLLGVGIVYGTSEPHVLRNAVLALAIADLGHLYATYAAMGPELYFDVASWSPVAWGNIGFTAFLFLNRVAYMLGLFGSKSAKASKSKKGN